MVKEGHFDRAYKEFSSALQINKKCSTAFVGRGLILLIKKDPKNAQREFHNALEACPTDEEAKKYLDDLSSYSQSPPWNGSSDGRGNWSESLFGFRSTLGGTRDEKEIEEQRRRNVTRKSVPAPPLELPLGGDNLPNFRRYNQHRARPPPPPSLSSTATSLTTAANPTSSVPKPSRDIRETLESRVARAQESTVRPSSAIQGSMNRIQKESSTEKVHPASNASYSPHRDQPIPKGHGHRSRPNAAARALASRYEQEAPSKPTSRRPNSSLSNSSHPNSSSLPVRQLSGSTKIYRSEDLSAGKLKVSHGRNSPGLAGPRSGESILAPSKVPRKRDSTSSTSVHEKDPRLNHSKIHAERDRPESYQSRYGKSSPLAARVPSKTRKSSRSESSQGPVDESAERPSSSRSSVVKPRASVSLSPDSSPLSSAPDMSDSDEDDAFYGLSTVNSESRDNLRGKRAGSREREGREEEERGKKRKREACFLEDSFSSKPLMERKKPIKACRARRVIMDDDSNE